MALNPVIGVLKRSRVNHKVSVKMEAETGVTWSQAKERLGLPEPGGGTEGFSLEPSEGVWP